MDPPLEEDACPYFKVRELTGRKFEADDGARVFLSEDNAMLRLNLEATVPACRSPPRPPTSLSCS